MFHDLFIFLFFYVFCSLLIFVLLVSVGLGFRPISPDVEKEGSLIWYQAKNSSNVKTWVDRADEFLLRKYLRGHSLICLNAAWPAFQPSISWEIRPGEMTWQKWPYFEYERRGLKKRAVELRHDVTGLRTAIWC